MNESIWLKNPKRLIGSQILPEWDMTQLERLNALTRLIILITLILIIAFWGTWVWLKFLICGLVVIIILWFSVDQRNHIAHYTCGTELINKNMYSGGYTNLKKEVMHQNLYDLMIKNTHDNQTKIAAQKIETIYSKTFPRQKAYKIRGP